MASTRRRSADAATAAPRLDFADPSAGWIVVDRLERPILAEPVAAAPTRAADPPPGRSAAAADDPQPVTVSDSGGIEGSSQVLTLTGTRGGYLSIRYEHYTIPDRLVISYGGKTYVDTGFIGGADMLRVYLPAGSSGLVSITLATNDPGTAWNYTVTFTPDAARGLQPPPPYLISARTGTFEDSRDGQSSTLADGTSQFGRSDGKAAELIIAGNRQTYTLSTFTVTGTTVSSGLTSLRAPLFSGSFTYDFAQGRTTALTDTNVGDLNLGGLATRVGSFALLPDRVDVELAITVLGVTIDTASLDGVSFEITGGGADFRGTTATLFSAARIDVEGITFVSKSLELHYDQGDNALVLHGAAELEIGWAGKAKTVSVDFRDEDDGIVIVDGGVSVAGTATIDEPFAIGKLKVDTAELSFDTRNHRYGGTIELKLPMFERGLSFSATFVVQDGLKLDALSAGVTHLDLRLAEFPIWLDSATIGAAGIAAARADDGFPDLVGTAKFGLFAHDARYGYLGTLTASVTISPGDMSVKANGHLVIIQETIVNGTVSAEFSWKDGIAKLSGLVTVAGGLVDAQAELTVNRLGVSGYLIGQINSLDLRSLVGGLGALIVPDDVVFGVRGYLNLTADGVDNDEIRFSLKGGDLEFGVGYNLNTNHVSLLNYRDVGTQASLALSSAAPAGAQPATFTVQPGAEAAIVVASWDVAATGVHLRLVAPDASVIQQRDFAQHGITIEALFGSSKSIGIRIADPLAGNWTVAVTDDSGLGTVAYHAFLGGNDSTLGIASVTSDAAGAITVALDPRDLDPAARVQLFWDDDAEGFNGTAIGAPVAVSSLALDGAGHPVLGWDGSGAARGSHFLYVVVADPDGTARSLYAEDPVRTGAGPDLTVTLTPDRDSAVLGGSVTYTVSVVNRGALAATDTHLTFERPVDAYFFGSSGFTFNGYPVTGTADFILGTVAAGQTVTGTVTLSIPSGTGAAQFTSAVGVATTGFEANLGNNDAVSVLSLPHLADADLTVTIALVDTPASVLDALSYVVTVVNHGAADAAHLVLSGFTSTVPATIVGPGSGWIGDTAAGGDGFQLMLDTLAAGASASWTVSGRPIVAGTYTATVAVSADNADPDLTDNGAAIALPVAAADAAATDVGLALTATTPASNGHSQVTLTVSNTSDTIAEQVVVRIALPGGIHVVAGVPTGGTYDPLTGLWTIGNVPDGGLRTLVFDVAGTGDRRISAEVVDMLTADNDSTPGNGVRAEDDQVTVVVALPQVADHAPGRVAISQNTILDGAGYRTIGTLTAPDADAGDTVAFRILDGAAGHFTLSGNQLVFNGYADYETATAYALTIEAYDNHGLSSVSSLRIKVTDVDGAKVVGDDTDQTIGSSVATNEEDRFDGGGGNDYVYGYGGNDVLAGGSGADSLYGSDGDDVLTGGSGADYLSGSTGYDTAVYRHRVVLDLSDSSHSRGDAAGDRFYQVEQFTLSRGNDKFAGSDYSGEVVLGGGGGDRLDGRGGDDVLQGGAGDDSLSGGDGDDVLTGGVGADRLAGQAGVDTVTYDTAVVLDLADPANSTGDAAGDALTSIEIVRLSAFGDHFVGLDATVAVFGGDGDDELIGSSAADILVGGAGQDVLTGGDGRDRFVFAAAGDSGPTPDHADVVTDFVTGKDWIDLSAIDARPLIPELQHLAFIGSQAFTALGQVRVAFVDGDAVLQANLSGDSAPEFSLVLHGVTSLAAADLIL